MPIGASIGGASISGSVSPAKKPANVKMMRDDNDQLLLLSGTLRREEKTIDPSGSIESITTVEIPVDFDRNDNVAINKEQTGELFSGEITAIFKESYTYGSKTYWPKNGDILEETLKEGIKVRWRLKKKRRHMHRNSIVGYAFELGYLEISGTETISAESTLPANVSMMRSDNDQLLLMNATLVRKSETIDPTGEVSAISETEIPITFDRGDEEDITYSQFGEETSGEVKALFKHKYTYGGTDYYPQKGDIVKDNLEEDQVMKWEIGEIQIHLHRGYIVGYSATLRRLGP